MPDIGVCPNFLGEKALFMFTEEDVTKLVNEGKSLNEIMHFCINDIIKLILKVEAQNFINENQEVMDNGHNRLILNGTHPERNFLVPSKAVSVKVPRVRDLGKGAECLDFKSRYIPKYISRSDDITALIPWLYLKGLSENDIEFVFKTQYGDDIKGLSSKSIGQLIHVWGEEYSDWSRRDLSSERYPYIWADGVFFRVREERDHHCQLMILGVNEFGQKKILGLGEGYAESAEVWKGMLVDLRLRGMSAPKMAVADGGLGFWAGLRDVYPDCHKQYCWFHKIKDVKRYLPKSRESEAVFSLQQIYRSDTRAEAISQVEKFKGVFEPKHPQAVKTVIKYTEELLSFYDFPAEHWLHLRTTNPIESIFSTVRLRTTKTRGKLSRGNIQSLVFKLAETASRNLNCINGVSKIKFVLDGMLFKDGVMIEKE
jgi:transposase-like protein